MAIGLYWGIGSPYSWRVLLAFERRKAHELRARFLPLETHYPALAAWLRRVESLPGYERTFPPHWRESLAPE